MYLMFEREGAEPHVIDLNDDTACFTLAEGDRYLRDANHNIVAYRTDEGGWRVPKAHKTNGEPDWCTFEDYTSVTFANVNAVDEIEAWLTQVSEVMAEEGGTPVAA